MRKLDDMKIWEEAYKQYCIDLNMPPYETQLEQLTCIIGHAMRLEYLDDPSQFESINVQEAREPKNNGIQTQQKFKPFLMAR